MRVYAATRSPGDRADVSSLESPASVAVDSAGEDALVAMTTKATTSFIASPLTLTGDRDIDRACRYPLKALIETK